MMDTASQLARAQAGGFLGTKQLALASASWLIYDYVICLDQEIKYFWTGSWNITRVLYFLNRYLPPLSFIIQIIYQFSPTLSTELCTRGIRAAVSFDVIGLVIVEAILGIRLYYLWSHNLPARVFLVASLVIAGGISIGYTGFVIHSFGAFRLVSSGPSVGCLQMGEGTYWPIFVPIFVVQTIFFVLTLLRIIEPLRTGKNLSVVRRLLRDALCFYFVVVASVVNILTASFMPELESYARPALTSNFLLAVYSICATHLIFSIQSLAAGVGCDAKYLLSDVELRRYNWRRGANNELIVEVDTYDREEPRESMTEEDMKELMLIPIPRAKIRTKSKPDPRRGASDSTMVDDEEGDEEIELQTRKGSVGGDLKGRSSVALLSEGGPLTVDPEGLMLQEEFRNWRLQDML